MNRRNRIRLMTSAEEPSHFVLCEFENDDGWAMVHQSVVDSLEHVRRDLCGTYSMDVEVLIKGSTRTEARLAALAAQYGWTDEGGLVSRDSKHLAKYGGIAVDIVARIALTKTRVKQSVLGAVCRRYFDLVKDDYADGHVHCDNRDRIGEKT